MNGPASNRRAGFFGGVSAPKTPPPIAEGFVSIRMCAFPKCLRSGLPVLSVAGAAEARARRGVATPTVRRAEPARSGVASVGNIEKREPVRGVRSPRPRHSSAQMIPHPPPIDSFRRSAPPSLASRIALVVAFTLVASGAARADRILLRGSQQPIANVTIDMEDFNEVIYKRPNVPDPQRIRSRDVREIEREPVSDAYAAGREQQKKGDYADAVKSFQLALGKDGNKPWVKEYAQFQLAESLFRQGLPDPKEMQAALSAYEKHKADFPKSRFLPDVEIGIGRALVELGRFRDAERHLTDLEGSARGRFGIIYELLAKKWNATTFERERRFGEAQTKYASLYQAATRALGDSDIKDFERRDIASLAAEARNLEGTCLILAGQFDRARDFYTSLIKEAEQKNDFETLAGAYNGLGESLFNLKKPAEALQMFARSATLYFYSDEQIARALYWMGLCEEEKQPGAPGLAASRLYYEQCAKQFPASEWAAKAKARMSK